MILADTSIWVNHWRVADLSFARLLGDQQVAMHPFVLGELAMGSIRSRGQTLFALRKMPSVLAVEHEEALALVEAHSLFSRGLSYVDAHLLATCRSHGRCRLLTRDRRLHVAAEELGVAP